MSPMLKRIIQKTGIPNLLELLSDLAPADLQSLLLEVMRTRTASTTPPALLRAYEQNPYAQPATLDPRKQLAVEQLALSCLSDHWTALECAPVAPLGTCSIPALCDQNKVLSALRHSEVLADITNYLSLEAARRRRDLLRTTPKSSERVHLSAIHRMIRTQPLKDPSHTPHFKLWGAVSAGRDQGSYRFELETLLTHLTLWLRFTERLQVEGFAVKDVNLTFTDFSNGRRTHAVDQQVIAPLQTNFGHLMNRPITWDPKRTQGLNYYRDLCYTLTLTNGQGLDLMLGDGGFTTWTASMLENKKERLLIGGFGIQLITLLF